MKIFIFAIQSDVYKIEQQNSRENFLDFQYFSVNQWVLWGDLLVSRVFFLCFFFWLTVAT